MTNNDKHKRAVEVLLVRSAEADKSEDAMRFSQAACNAANAMFALKKIAEEQPK